MKPSLLTLRRLLVLTALAAGGLLTTRLMLLSQAAPSGQPCGNYTPGGPSQPCGGGGTGGGGGGSTGNEPDPKDCPKPDGPDGPVPPPTPPYTPPNQPTDPNPYTPPGYDPYAPYNNDDPNSGDTDPDSDCESENAFSPYTGNATRKITDLRLFGSQGRLPLAFTRFSNTRMSPQATQSGGFGREGVWTHSYQFYMRDGGTFTNGQPQIKVALPNGGDYTFVQNVDDPTLWLGPANVSLRIVQNGTQYTLMTPEGNLFVFARRPNSANTAFFYRLESFEDSIGNVYTVTFNNATDTLIRQITDPSGRWLKLTYQNMAITSQASTTLASVAYDDPQGGWQEITVSSTKTFRYLALVDTNDYHNAPPLPVGEIEFYDANGTKLSGTTFASDPLFVDDPNSPNAHEGAMATDGDTSTYYRYNFMRNGYVGIDLGSGAAVQVSKIRYFIPSGVAANTAAFQFVGFNATPVNNYVVKQVQGSDGRTVVYNYSTFADAGGLFSWPTLTQTVYPDGALANYGYTQPAEFIRPVLTDISDVRVSKAPLITYKFSGDDSVGFVTEEKGGVSGETIASTGFTAAHKPQAIYPNGRVITYEHSTGNANVVKKTNGLGKITSFSYGDGGAGFLTSKTSANGVTTGFTRDVQGRLTSMTRVDGSVSSFTRDSRGRITGEVTSGVGLSAPRTTTIARDGGGRPSSITTADGGTSSYTYNGFGRVATATLPSGATVTNGFDATGRITSRTDSAGRVTSYTYNSLDLPATMTDAAGHTTSYTYNDRGQVTKTTYHDGTFVQHSFDDFGNRIGTQDESGQFWSSAYDEFNRKVNETDPTGRTTTYSYGAVAGVGCGACNMAAKPTLITSPSGRKVRNQYDVEWHLTSQTVAYGSVDAASTAYTYDAVGNLLTVTDAQSHKTTHVYDSRSRRIKTTDPLGRITQYAYDAKGNVIQVTAPNGGVTTRTYDAMDRLLSETNALNQTTTYTYDAQGHLTSSTSPAGRVQTRTYDAGGRLLTSTLGAGTAEAATTTYAYDAQGRLATVTDPLGHVITHAYGTRDRRISTTDALSRVTQFAYDAQGRITQTTFPDGTTTSTTYDASGRVLTQTDERGVTTGYTYDQDGRMTALTDGNGHTRTWVYDSQGRLLNHTHPDGGTESYTYRLDGTVATRTTPAGKIETYTYLANGLLQKRTWSDGSPQVTYTYDTLGRPITLHNNLGDITYTYDLLDRVVTSGQTFPIGAARAVGFTYDADGFTSALTYPDGNVVTYDYTARGQMNSVTAGAPPPLAVYGYDLDGRLVTKGLENGLLSTMAYDNANQLTGISHAVGVTGVDSIGYTLDMRGRRTGISRSGGRNDGYSYDPAGQVIAGGYDATAAGSQTDGFAYDAAGNRTTAARNGSTTAYAANAADQYASVGGTAQAYDPAGNQTSLQLPGGPLIALTYDAENRLTSEEKSTGIARADKARVVNSYDSLQRRVRKQIYARNSGDTAWTLSKTILYTYEGWNIIEEREFLTSALTPASTYYRYTWGADVSGSRQGAGGVGGLIMTEEVPATGTATAHFYAYDGNGNVTHVLDATGTVEAQYRYSAFGGDLGSTTSTAFAQRNPWRFSTKYLDREVETSEGFYYYGYRHYFTALGRWGSRDPIQEEGGLNLYAMLDNDPVSWADRLGLKCSITISARHFNVHEGPRKGNRRRFQNFKPDKGCGADKIGFVGCGSNRFNEQANAGGFGVPGMPQNNQKYPGHPINDPPYDSDFGGQGYKPNDYDTEDEVPGALDQALQAAEKQAAGLCKDYKACCKEITIKVECSPDLTDQEKRNRPVGTGKNLCGTEKKVPCNR